MTLAPNMPLTLDDIDRELLQIDRELCERSLGEFLRQAWPVMEPEVEYLPNWHIDCIADYLTAVDRGEILRLVINMPPRYLKSTTVTIGWPTWTWTHKPWEKFMCASYAAELSTGHSVDRRSLIESEWYQDRWGQVFELTSDQNSKAHFTNDRGGAMLSTGMTGRGMGFGCNRLIIDDPHDPKKAESEKERRTTIKAFRQKFTRRLNDKKTGAIVIVMQRLHAEDLSGVALEMGYTHLCLEGQAKKRRYISLPTTLPAGCPVECDCATCTQRARDQAKREGVPPPPEERDPPEEGEYFERPKGDFLHEAREGEKEHAQAVVELGPEGYSHQYDQLANPEDGIKFKRKNFRYFEDKGSYLLLHQPDGSVNRVLKSECIRFSTCDTAMSEETTADPTAIGEWYLTKEKDLLLDEVLNERMEDPEVEAAIRNTIRRCLYLTVEKKQNGMTIFQRLVREGLPIKAVPAEGDKIARSTTASIDSANGKLYFRADAPWLGDYENQLLQFPNGAHDDMVDMTSYASIEKSQEFTVEAPTGRIGVYAGASA